MGFGDFGILAFWEFGILGSSLTIQNFCSCSCTIKVVKHTSVDEYRRETSSIFMSMSIPVSASVFISISMSVSISIPISCYIPIHLYVSTSMNNDTKCLYQVLFTLYSLTANASNHSTPRGVNTALQAGTVSTPRGTLNRLPNEHSPASRDGEHPKEILPECAQPCKQGRWAPRQMVGSRSRRSRQCSDS